MYELYHVAARLYLLLTALVAPVISLGACLLIKRAAAKRLYSHVRWLRPAAVGATLSGSGILVIAVVILVDPQDYGLAVVGYLLSTVGFVSSLVSCWRLWGVMNALPPAPEEGDADARRQEGVWAAGASALSATRGRQGEVFWRRQGNAIKTAPPFCQCQPAEGV